MRICGYCAMPNHWHMVLWPEHDGDLSAFIQHLTNLHVKRWKRAQRDRPRPPLPGPLQVVSDLQTTDYFHAVVRYVERNPLRANLVSRAEAGPLHLYPSLTNRRIPTNLANMINVNIHDAKTNLSALVRAVEERGETVILQRHGKPVAEIHAYGSRGDAGGFTRDLVPDPDLLPRLAPGYDPTEPLADDEWPTELR